jgi:hypothetical protein
VRPATRAALVFGLGTTAVALLQIMATGQVGVRRHSTAVVQAALLCGAVVGALAGVAGAIATLGRHVDALEGPTEQLLRVLGNPLFWLGVLGVGAIVQLLRRSRHGAADGPATAS